MAANYDPVHFILSNEMIRADLGSLFCTRRARVQMSNVIIGRKLHLTFKHPPRPAPSRAIKLSISLDSGEKCPIRQIKISLFSELRDPPPLRSPMRMREVCDGPLGVPPLQGRDRHQGQYLVRSSSSIFNSSSMPTDCHKITIK